MKKQDRFGSVKTYYDCSSFSQYLRFINSQYISSESLDVEQSQNDLIGLSLREM